MTQNLIGTLLILLLGQFAAGTFCFGTVQFLRGKRASVLDCIRRGAGDLVLVLGTAFLVGLRIAVPAALVVLAAFLLGMALEWQWIVFVAVLVALVWSVREAMRLWVAVPAAVMERLGPVAACRRSIEITQGNRLRIFLLGVVVGLVIWIVSAVVMMPMVGEASPRAIAYVAAGLQIVWSVINAVLAAVCYYLLRRMRENVDADQIAAAFG